MRRRDRARAEHRLEINLTPLLDVVLQLITFFLMLVHFGARLEGSTQAVRLPRSAAGMPAADLAVDRLVAVVDRAGQLVVDGVGLDETAADGWWADQADRRREGLALIGRGDEDELATAVLIRADRDAPYGVVRGQLVSAQAHGFARFTLVVLQEGRD